MNDIQAEHDSNDGDNGNDHGDGDNGNDRNGDRGDDRNDGNDRGDRGDGNDRAIGYADAMAELEQTLRDLEGDDLDVDMLASRVERASFLIGLCRKRIGAARVQVERVVADLDSEDDEYGAETDSEPEADGD